MRVAEPTFQESAERAFEEFYASECSHGVQIEKLAQGYAMSIVEDPNEKDDSQCLH